MATVTAPILLDSTGQQIKAALEEVSILPQIVDNLTTSDATKALSAKQGTVLNSFEYYTTTSGFNSTYVNECHIRMAKFGNFVLLSINITFNAIATIPINTVLVTLPKWFPKALSKHFMALTKLSNDGISFYRGSEFWEINTNGQLKNTSQLTSSQGREEVCVFVYAS